MKYFRKTSLIFFAFLLVLPISANQFYIGLTGGINFTRVHSDVPNVINNGLSQEFSTATRIGIGGIFGLSLGKNLFLQMEPMYLQKGSKVQGEFDLNIQYSTLEIPLLLKLTFGKKIQPYVFFGPALAILLDSKWNFFIEGYSLNGDAKDVSRGMDFGVVMGAGIGFPFGRGTFFLNCRYNFGLANLIKTGTIELESVHLSTTVEITDEQEITSEGFQIMCGFTFPLGKK